MATVHTQSSPSPRGPMSTIDPTLTEAWKRFEAAFNRRDPKEVASHWTEDGTLLSPLGSWGSGRAGVEKVYAEDSETVLRGTRSTFTIQSARMIDGDTCLVDLDHALENARMPDGSQGTARLHLVVLARRQGKDWRWLDARPYGFMPRPPSPQVH